MFCINYVFLLKHFNYNIVIRFYKGEFMSEIESSLIEDRVFFPDAKFSENAKLPDMSSYKDMCQSADKDYEQFWAKLGSFS